jgi:hypothetical protein
MTKTPVPHFSGILGSALSNRSRTISLNLERNLSLESAYRDSSSFVGSRGYHQRGKVNPVITEQGGSFH